MPKLSSIAIAASFTLCLAACNPGGDLPDLPPISQNGYRLGGGDQIRIITFGVDQLSGNFRVDDQGNVDMPLIGAVHAAGQTPAELADTITTRLRGQKFVREPSVSVEVLAYRPIFVLGEVARPGQYPYSPGMTMLTAVAVAGGFTYRAVEGYASDIRTIDGHAVQGKIMPSSFLAPGDVIKIYERHF
jgi:polysaccharide export outer membrane protein